MHLQFSDKMPTEKRVGTNDTEKKTRDKRQDGGGQRL